MQVFSYTYVIFLCGVYVNSNAVYTERFNNDRSKAHYDTEEVSQQQPVMIAEDPPPGIPYGVPIFYQRLAPPGYIYGEYLRPRQRFVPGKQYYESPAKRAEYYYMGKAEEPERRQCRSLGRRRSVSYAKQPFKPAGLREESSSYYASDMNSPSHSQRVERHDLYHAGRQYEESEENFAEGNQNERFADDKYPAVLANFKIGSKLDKKSVAESSKLLKREYRQNDTGVVKEKGSSTDSISETDSDGKVAEELRDILDYMGLIDEDSMPNAKAAVDKREEAKKGTFEDENMEEGDNKISLTKEERRSTSKDRSKREEKSSVCTEVPVAASTVSESEHQKDRSSISTKEPDRSKRESKRQDDNSTMSHASSIDESDNIDTNDYEKRMERQIQNRINALKEEVKREIASLKAQEAAQAVHNLNDDSQRKKRQVISTLVDEESSDLDPALHPDGALKPHVRKRRNAEDEVQLQSNQYEQTVSRNHTKPVHTRLNSLKNSTYSKINYSMNYTNYTKNIRINDTQNYIVTFDSMSNKSAPKEDNAAPEAWKPTTLNSGHHQQNYSSNVESGDLCTSGIRTLGVTSDHGKIRKKREITNMNFIPSRYAPGYVAIPEAAMAYVPYNGNYEADEAEGAIDYDRYYGRLANVQEMRQVGIYPVKRSLVYGGGPGQGRSRRRRDQDAVAFHGGGATQNHLSAVRARRMGPQPRVRRKVYYKREVRNRRPQTLSDMSDTDLFGALPQSYDGELSRFKRVRRSRKKG